MTIRRFAILLILAVGLMGQAGTGELIETRISELNSIPEMPTYEQPVPQGVLALVSWNVEVGFTSPNSPERLPLLKDALGNMFGGSYHLLAAQEVANSDDSNVLLSLLPELEESETWQASFFNTNDGQDNGFWCTPGVSIKDAELLFVTDEESTPGVIKTDKSRAVHPPQAAHVTVGDFDFTLVTVHLYFKGGKTEEAVRELKVLLNWLDEYFNTPDHDPDVIIAGDFNIPSVLSGQTGQHGITVDPIFDEDSRFQDGERRFVVLVHEPTSRKTGQDDKGKPSKNYDHFIVSADVLEELILARRLSPDILLEHPKDPEVDLTSNHFPIVAFFRTEGENVSPDVTESDGP